MLPPKLPLESLMDKAGYLYGFVVKPLLFGS